jgi:hypothetical protein
MEFGYIRKIFKKNTFQVCRYLPVFNPSTTHNVKDYVMMIPEFTKQEILENWQILFPKEELFEELELMLQTKHTFGFQPEEFEPNQTIWFSQTGEMLVSEMSDSHLRNDWNYFCQENGIQGVYDYYQQKYNEAVNDEISDNFSFFMSDPIQLLYTEANQIRKKWMATIKGLLAIKEEMKRRNLTEAKS